MTYKQRHDEGDKLPCGHDARYWQPRTELDDTRDEVHIWEGRCRSCGALIDELYDPDGILRGRRLMN